MTTYKDMVADVRSRLSASLGDELNTLAAPYTPGDTTITLTMDPQRLAPGMRVSCGLNVWYVTSVNSALKQATIIAGIDGAPSQAAASGDLVRINPRVTDHAIFTAIQDQVRHMSSPSVGLGVIDFWIDLANYTTNLYEPPTGIVPDRISGAFGKYGDEWYPVKRYAWELGAVHVYDETPFVSYTFLYRDAFDVPTSLTQDPEADTKMSSTMLDIPVLGATGMLLLSEENRRSQVSAQGDTRRPTEVQAGSNMGAGREMLRMRDQRINDEYTRSLHIAPIGGGA